jgi:eukaryotic-like serine/threonine-protein kinase
VPRVVGKQLVQARAILERKGFEVKETHVRSAQEFDQVLDQDPNFGEREKKGSTITLEVSNGPGDVRVPSVERLTKERAIKELANVDLKVTQDEEPSDTIKRGFATRTGPEAVTVPDVVGLSRDSAESQLDGKGLEVVVQEISSDKPKDEVVSQSPTGGTRLQKGERVTITVSKGKEKAQVPDVVGLSSGDAASTLRSAGLGVVKHTRTVDNQDEDGNVIDQSPAGGSEVDKGRQVVIVVGKFKAQTTPTPPPVQPGP